ncbi:hypothetical protein Agub_g14749, partial [Astrephomene gubernaculifera]
GCAGGRGAHASGVPWFLQHESRRAFVARALRSLIAGGPCEDHPQLCLAYLLVEASQALADDDTTATITTASDAAPTPTEPQQQPQQQPLPCLDRARQAARSLLSQHRNSLPLLAALAALEEAAGQTRAARRIRDAALAGAAALPEQQRHLLPLLVHQYVEAERAAAAAAAAAAADATAGGGGGGGGGGGATAAAALEHALRAHHVLRWFLTAAAAAAPTGGCTTATAAAAVTYVPYKAGGAVTRDDVAAARRGFESRIPGLLATRGGSLDAPSASHLYLGGLFECLTGRLFPAAGGGGTAAALTVFKHAAAAVPAAVRQASGYHEALAVSYCGLLVSELAEGGTGSGGGGGVQPGRVRDVLMQALELYPHSPLLLALRVQLGRALRGRCRLRRDLAALAAGLRRAAEGAAEQLAEEAEAAREGGAVVGPTSPSSAAPAIAAAAVWWAQMAAETEEPEPQDAHMDRGFASRQQQPQQQQRRLQPYVFRKAADPRVTRLLERAAAARHLAPCAAVWATYLAHEAAAAAVAEATAAAARAGSMGNGAGAGAGAAATAAAAATHLSYAKRVFLRAVREVPLSKEVWLQGLELLGCEDAADGGTATAETAG